MKRFFSILAVALTIFATSALVSSCNKEEAKKSSLAGTTWVFDAVIAQVSYSFIDDTTVQYSSVIAGQTIATINGTYTYNNPNVTVKFTNQGQTGTATGVISGDTLTMNEDGQTVVYTKK